MLIVMDDQEYLREAGAGPACEIFSFIFFFFNESTFFSAELFCSVLCLHGSTEWHLPYSLLLVFDLPSCPEEPGFSSLFLDIRATAVQTAHF